jgi:hypothetical protein
MESSNPTIEVSSKLAYFQPGMYIVRLAEDAQDNVLTLYPSPVGRGTVDFFPGDGVLRNTLAKVGDCIVVRVKGATGSILLTEFHKAGQQHRMTLKIDRIATEGFEGLGASAAPERFAAASTATGQVAVRQLGHVEQVGDVVVQDGWLGDPLSDQRLEGFAVSVTGLPEGVTLNYAALVEGTRRYASAVSGQFVGTRQKAKALLGVAFDLAGPNADKFLLSGSVVFAGYAPLAIEPGIQMTGPSGTEYLVALQVSIRPKAARSTAASAWEDPAITKITRQSPVTASSRAPAKKVAAQKAVAKKGPQKRS